MKPNRRVSLCSDDGALFQYGPRTGCRSFKVQMAKFLSDGYEDDVREDNLGEKRGSTTWQSRTRTNLLYNTLQFSLAGPRWDCG